MIDTDRMLQLKQKLEDGYFHHENVLSVAVPPALRETMKQLEMLPAASGVTTVAILNWALNTMAGKVNKSTGQPDPRYLRIPYDGSMIPQLKKKLFTLDGLTRVA